MEKEVHVAEVKAFKTRSGNTRFVLRDDDGNEYTTFREAIARQALAAEGGRARIECHEEQRNGFRNVYLDKVDPLEDDEPAAAGRDEDDREAEEVAWRTAVEAAPWLLGDSPKRSVSPERFFEKLKPFKELVADDIRDGDDEGGSG
jgi:predicted DNA-binding transcriptional regulator YafY